MRSRRVVSERTDFPIRDSPAVCHPVCKVCACSPCTLRRRNWVKVGIRGARRGSEAARLLINSELEAKTTLGRMQCEAGLYRLSGGRSGKSFLAIIGLLVVRRHRERLKAAGMCFHYHARSGGPVGLLICKMYTWLFALISQGSLDKTIDKIRKVWASHRRADPNSGMAVLVASMWWVIRLPIEPCCTSSNQIEKYNLYLMG